MIRRILTVAMPMVFAHAVAAAQAPAPIPRDDSDLSALLDGIAKVERFAEQCASARCARFSCERGQALFGSVRDARIDLTHLVYWLTRASQAHNDHVTAHHENASRTAERVARSQLAIGLHEFLHRLAASLLDIAGSMKGFKELMEQPERFTRAEALKRIDATYELLKDTESATSGIVEIIQESHDTDLRYDPMVSDLPGAMRLDAILGVDQSTINDLKSHLSDAASIVQGAAEHGRDLEALRGKAGVRQAVLQIIGRAAKQVSALKLEERKAFLEGLLRDLAAEQAAQSDAFEDWQRVSTRRHRAIEAWSRIEKLYSDPEGLSACVVRRCGAVDSTAGPDLPDAVVPDEPIVDPRNPLVDPASTALGYGEALPYLNALLPEIQARLSRVPSSAREAPPRLELPASGFRPGAAMSVRFRGSSCWPKDAWVGVVPSEVSHGRERVNDSHALPGTVTYLRGRAEGTISLEAPSKDGAFDLRMNDTDADGSEAASVSFQVASEEPTATDAPNSCFMAGRFTSSPGTIVVTREGNRVVGVYQDGRARAVGTLSGQTVSGTFQNDVYGSHGDFAWTFARDGRSFEGWWRNDSGIGEGTWGGKCVSSADDR